MMRKSFDMPEKEIIQSGNNKPLNLGIMGGTFDPIHIGHLVTAEEAWQQYGLDKVIFIPAGLPPHKEAENISDSEHRYMMTVLAVINNPRFYVSRYEIDKTSPSYTIDTVRYLLRYYGKGTNIYFITGTDAVLEILTWKDYEELLNSCHFIAASRPGYTLERLQTKAEGYYPDILEKVHLLENPAMSVSSTFIRSRVREGKTIKYLTSELVEHYIYKNNLYL